MIIFKKLRYKNFLSTGDRPIEIDFLKTRTTLFCGKNGQGKSTVSDALFFALYGKAYRNINKPQLVNTINQRDCVVEVEFQIGTHEYLVRRGIKPNFLEVYDNGKLVDQDSKNSDYQLQFEQTILKIPYHVFKQIIILGSTAYVPFLELSAWNRRQLIETVLDIEIFTRMNEVLKEKYSILEAEIKQLDVNANVIIEKMNLQKEHILQLKKKTREHINEQMSVIEETKKLIQELLEKNNLSSVLISEKMKLFGDQVKVNKDHEEMDELRKKITFNHSQLQKEMAFFNDNKQCPLCEQDICDEHKENISKTKSKKIEELKSAITEIDVFLKQSQDKLSEFSTMKREVSSIQSEIQSRLNLIQGHQTFIDAKERDIESAMYNNDDIVDQEKKFKAFTEEKTVIENQKKEKNVVLDRYEKALVLLKDNGIKTKIIRQYLPTMNKMINNYLSMLDFYVNFNLDENFNEVISSRNRSEFTFASFSEGEKFRINVALLFTWREIAKMKNSNNTNLLFLDEILDSSLDQNGTEEFMKMIKTMSPETNIFIISHKTEGIQDKFDRVLMFNKEKNFTKVVEI